MEHPPWHQEQVHQPGDETAKSTPLVHHMHSNDKNLNIIIFISSNGWEPLQRVVIWADRKGKCGPYLLGDF